MVAADYVLPAGATIGFRFPELPPTLQHAFDGNGKVPELSISLPADYRCDRRYPLLCWLGGGGGGVGGAVNGARRILGLRGAIGLNLPLFKRHVAALKANGSNTWMRLFVRQSDAKQIWDCYRLMLEQVFATVPNIDRERCAIGGFSNGAHTTAVLLGRRRSEIRRYFNAAIFAEGGVHLKPTAALDGCPAVMYLGAEGGRDWLSATAEKIQSAGYDLDFVAMDRVGHAFPRRYEQHLRRWLRARWDGIRGRR